MTHYLFFSGKGGVGKTTLSTAAAIHHAMLGRKTLIITTDPAANLADVFEQEIGHRITPIRGIKNLQAMEINPDAAVAEYKERILAPYREILSEDLLSSVDEQLSGPCTLEVAAFDRFIDFMEGEEYDVMVFDTAPTGHTIRLLELPVDWSNHIDEASRGSGQTCLGPVQTLQGSKEKYDRAMALLRDLQRTRFIFVMRPDELSLYETLRASKELSELGIESGEVIINGILPQEACTIDFFRKKFDAQQEIIRKACEVISKPTRYMMLRSGEVKGTDALKEVAAELFHENGSYRYSEPTPCVKATATDGVSSLPVPDLDRLWLPEGAPKAVFFTGKGGVGKTTLSCMAALQIARKGLKTLLVTTDPAAHIGQVLDMEIGDHPTTVTENLDAARVDQEAAFIEYKERTLNEARGRYSDEMLRAMEEELNSPCTEEMAAFDKFIRYIEEGTYEVIVFDTAPTGHTLRLLDLPFDYAKEAEGMQEGAGRVKEETEDRFRKIIETIRDPKRSVFSLVLYPEYTPMIESYRAMLDLRKAGIETRMVVANLILPEAVCGNPFFRSRRRMQMKYLQEIHERFQLPILEFPMLRDELRGLPALEEAAMHLETKREERLKT